MSQILPGKLEVVELLAPFAFTLHLVFFNNVRLHGLIFIISIPEITITVHSSCFCSRALTQKLAVLP